MAKMNTSLLMHFLKMSRFTGITGEEVFFDENGDGPGRYRLVTCFFSFTLLTRSIHSRYDILNLQDSSGDNEHPHHYVQVGTWSTGKLELNTSMMRFLAKQEPLENISVQRACSEPCPNGFVKVQEILMIDQDFQRKLLYNFDKCFNLEIY